MNTSPLFHGGPVRERLRSLQGMFRDAFPPGIDHGICLWIVQDQDEITMIDALVRTEETAEAVFPDLFVPLYGANAGAGSWIKELGEEIRARLRSVADDLEPAGVPTSLWKNDPGVNDLADLISYALRISDQLPHLNGRTVLFFNPPSFGDETRFAMTFVRALNEGLPPGVVLMVWAYPGSVLSDQLASREDLGVRTLTPNLKMSKVAGEILDTGDRTSPPVKFQKLFMQLSEHGNRGAMDLLRSDGEKAIAIAQQIPGWEHMVATVLITVGSLLLSRSSNRREAAEYFSRARRQAEVARNAGSPDADAVLMQAFTFEALGLFHLGDFTAAARHYEQAAAVTEEEAYAYNRFEALRMATHCYLQHSDYDLAWATALRGLEEAESLDPQLAANSTVPFLARDLLSLVEHLNQFQREPELRGRIITVAGADWESKLAQMETRWRTGKRG